MKSVCCAKELLNLELSASLVLLHRLNVLMQIEDDCFLFMHYMLAIKLMIIWFINFITHLHQKCGSHLPGPCASVGCVRLCAPYHKR